MKSTFLILGGYGNTGLLIADYLLKETNVNLILAGRNFQKAKYAANDLNRKYECNKVSAEFADAANYDSLLNAFSKSEFAIIASSTMKYVQNVAKAALVTNNNYLDTQLSAKEKVDELRGIEDQIKNKSLLFITDGGYHPGIISALVRYANHKFDKLIKANVYAYMNLDWKSYEFSKDTSKEFLSEFKNYNPLVYKNSKWKNLEVSKFPKYNFGGDFGDIYCSPMFMEELRELPLVIPSLQETGFFIGGMDWFTTYITIPLGMAMLKVIPHVGEKIMGAIFEWGTKKFSKPPFLVKIVIEAEGLMNGEESNLKIELSHEDGYVMTAIPVVACLLQYLNRKIGKAGLWFQGNIVEPVSFINDIKRMGINIKETKIET